MWHLVEVGVGYYFRFNGGKLPLRYIYRCVVYFNSYKGALATIPMQMFYRVHAAFADGAAYFGGVGHVNIVG